MGRFFYPALSSLSILAFYGLSRWLTLFSIKEQSPNLQSPISILALFTNLGMATLTIVALWGYLAPAYTRPAGFGEETAVPNPTNDQFDSFVMLRGYEIRETSLSVGEPLDIDLYWEVLEPPPGDYLMFMHLIDNETGVMVAQRDTHPGLGRFPSSTWQAGDRFVDSMRLWLPETAYAPSSATLSIGLYARNAYRLPIVDANGDHVGDAVEISNIVLSTMQGSGFDQQFPNPQSHNFADIAELLGYAYGQRVVAPGDALQVDTYWQALQDSPGDYKFQFILRNQNGVIVATKKGRPHQGELPTTEWAQGQIVTDRQYVPIPDDLEPGTYLMEVRLFNNDTKQAGPLLDENGHMLNNHLSLASIRIRPSP